MAKSPTEMIRELAAELRVSNERIDALREEAHDRRTVDQRFDDRLREVVQELRAELAEVRRENAVLQQRIDDLTKRAETWGNRLWGLILALVGATLSLASGLIATLARK